MTISIESSASDKPIRVVLDTNVLISAAISGIQAEYVLVLVDGGKLTGFTSLTILSEVRRKLSGKLGQSTERCNQFERTLLRILTVIEPTQFNLSKLRDQTDLHVLGTAVAADANLIITTDPDLLTLRHFKKIGIVHPKTLRWTFPK